MIINYKVTVIKTVLYCCKNRQKDKEINMGNAEVNPLQTVTCGIVTKGFSFSK